jgi:hypothetical protein
MARKFLSLYWKTEHWYPKKKTDIAIPCLGTGHDSILELEEEEEEEEDDDDILRLRRHKIFL